MTGGLRQRLRYPLKQNLDRVAAGLAPTAGYSLSVESLQLSNVRVDEDTLSLRLDLGLGIR